MLRRPLVGVGEQVAQIGLVVAGVHLVHRVKIIAVTDQHLVESHVEFGKVAFLHLALGALDPAGDGGVAGDGVVDGDQLVAEQLHHAVVPAVQVKHPQILGILAAGHDIGAIDHDGLSEGGVGVAGDDDVDALHLFGELVVLALALSVGARVGQADDHRLHAVPLHAVGHRRVHHPLGGLDVVVEDHAGHGGALVGVHAHDAQNGVPHAAALQQDVVRHAVVGEGVPHGLRRLVIALLALGGGQIVGLHDGGHLIAAVRRGVQHRREALRPVVILVVAEGGGVVAHLPHDPQLEGRVRIGRLEQGAHGKIAAVHQQRVGIQCPLLVDDGLEPGIAAAEAAALAVGRREQVGMHIVGEQNGDPGALPGLRRPGGEHRKGHCDKHGKAYRRQPPKQFHGHGLL